MTPSAPARAVDVDLLGVLGPFRLGTLLVLVVTDSEVVRRHPRQREPGVDQRTRATEDRLVHADDALSEDDLLSLLTEGA